MLKQIKIGSKTISETSPLYIVAEVGITCNYDMTISKELIRVVKEAGADAIKFILWFPEEIMSDKTVNYTYGTVKGTVTENMFEMLNKLRFTLDQWLELKEYADENKVTLFATVNSPSGIEWAEKMKLEAYKFSSWDFNYHPLWKKIANMGKPMIIDTGPVNLLDVAKVMKIMQDAGNEQAILVHNFHSDKPEKYNMLSIPYMKTAFECLVGFSAKDRDHKPDIMAITLGSVLIEKRLTMSRTLPGHHHIISLEPDEFKDYVKMVRQIQSAMGEWALKPSPADLVDRKKFFRHLVANQDIPAGTTLTEEMLEGKRLENGISPEYIDFFVGRKTKRLLSYNESITWDIV